MQIEKIKKELFEILLKKKFKFSLKFFFLK